MRIAIIAPGSRGDIQPYAALGVGLLQAGHAVTVVTNRDFTGLLDSYGLRCLPVDVSVEEALNEVESRNAVEGGGTLKSFSRFAELARRSASLLVDAGMEACRDADAILTGLGGVFIAAALGEKTGLPVIQAYNVPLTPTGAYPGVLLGLPRALQTPWMNRLSHRLTRGVVWMTARAGGNAARQKQLGLRAAPRFGGFDSPALLTGPILYGLSRHVLPPGPEWDARVQTTGFWFLNEPTGWTPPADLLSFINDGPPPVSIGFGSMGHKDPRATFELVVEALRLSGNRGVVLSGWSGLKDVKPPAHVHLASNVPHAWLFPRMAAVVHHGGAGTTAAGLRAGVPSVVVPYHGDQPFWGDRVAALGVGPAPLARNRLTAAALARALQQATTDGKMRQEAAALGERVRAEDGVARAVEAIGNMASASQRAA